MPPLDVRTSFNLRFFDLTIFSRLTFMHDMEEKGYIAKQTATGDKLENIMQYNYSVGQAPVKLAIKEGTFC